MKTHKEKAEELVEKFSTLEDAKNAVDEIIEQYIKFSYWHDRVGKEGIEYWQEVKNELNNM